MKRPSLRRRSRFVCPTEEIVSHQTRFTPLGVKVEALAFAARSWKRFLTDTLRRTRRLDPLARRDAARVARAALFFTREHVSLEL